MKLFRLTIDFAFKAVFGKNPDLLMGMLNSFPQFQGTKQIKSLTILNPEMPKELIEEKLSILDIKADDLENNQFIIEMQAFPQSEFPKRALYYWAKSYSRNLGKGYDYSKLKKVYSFNFLNFTLFILAIVKFVLLNFAFSNETSVRCIGIIEKLKSAYLKLEPFMSKPEKLQLAKLALKSL